MKSLISPTFGEPAGYEIRESDDLRCGDGNQILVQVKASSINAHDVIMASGRTKAVQNVKLPYRIGLDFAGVVIATGSATVPYSVGDSVFGFAFHTGTVATHVLIDLDKPHALAKIPPGLSFNDAASLPAVGLTADLVLAKANVFFKESGGLTGKTIFIPAALGGVGSIALQLAKQTWRCKTITAVSTAKLDKLTHYLGQGIVDDVHDYTKGNLTAAIGAGTVDFVFDTTGKAGDYLPLIKRGGLCISIARLPPGSALKEQEQSRVACIGQNVMDGLDATFRTWAKTRYGVTYLYQKTDPVSSDLDTFVEKLQAQHVHAVVGDTADLDNLEKIKTECDRILKGKGGVGKFVVTVNGGLNETKP